MSLARSELELRERERDPWISFMQVSRGIGGTHEYGTRGVQVGVDLPIFRLSGSTLGTASAAVDQRTLEQEAARAAIIAEVD